MMIGSDLVVSRSGVKDFLLRGGNINRWMDLDWPMIFSVILQKDIDLLGIFIFNDANLNIVNPAGKTPLMIAAAQGDLSLVKVLTYAGADLMVEDTRGRNALFYAVRSYQLTLIQFLLQRGMSREKVDREGRNLAMMLALAPYRDLSTLDRQVKEEDVYCTLLDLFLDEGDVNHRDHFGRTLLHYAIWAGKEKLVEILLGYPGVDLSVVDEEGMTPLDLADLYGQIPLAEQLEVKGATHSMATEELSVRREEIYGVREREEVAKILSDLRVVDVAPEVDFDLSGSIENGQVVEPDAISIVGSGGQGDILNNSWVTGGRLGRRKPGRARRNGDAAIEMDAQVNLDLGESNVLVTGGAHGEADDTTLVSGALNKSKVKSLKLAEREKVDPHLKQKVEEETLLVKGDALEEADETTLVSAALNKSKVKSLKLAEREKVDPHLKQKVEEETLLVKGGVPEEADETTLVSAALNKSKVKSLKLAEREKVDPHLKQKVEEETLLVKGGASEEADETTLVSGALNKSKVKSLKLAEREKVDPHFVPTATGSAEGAWEEAENSEVEMGEVGPGGVLDLVDFMEDLFNDTEDFDVTPESNPGPSSQTNASKTTSTKVGTIKSAPKGQESVRVRVGTAAPAAKTPVASEALFELSTEPLDGLFTEDVDAVDFAVEENLQEHEHEGRQSIGHSALMQEKLAERERLLAELEDMEETTTNVKGKGEQDRFMVAKIGGGPSASNDPGLVKIAGGGRAPGEDKMVYQRGSNSDEGIEEIEKQLAALRNKKGLLSKVAEQKKKQLAALANEQEREVDVNQKNIMGQTPLMLAAAQSTVDQVKKLLEKGADLGVRDKDGRSSLTYAVSAGNLATAEFLIRCGAMVDIKDGSGKTPIQYAVMKNRPDLVKLLAEYKASLRVRYKGMDLLMLASSSGGLQTVQYLMKIGFDPNYRDLRNRSAADFAREHDHKAVETYLRSFMKKTPAAAVAQAKAQAQAQGKAPSLAVAAAKQPLAKKAVGGAATKATSAANKPAPKGAAAAVAAARAAGKLPPKKQYGGLLVQKKTKAPATPVATPGAGPKKAS